MIYHFVVMNLKENDMFGTNKRKSIIKSRLVRVLLNHPEGHLTKYRVAQLSKTKYPWTHQILKNLEMQEIVNGTKVLQFQTLLKLWLGWELPYWTRDYLIRNPVEMLRETKLQYALTTYRAENLIQSYLFPTRTDFHICLNDKLKWHRLLTENGLVGAGNTRIIISSEHVFYNSHEKDGLHVSSIPQIIFDLYKEGGVCIEAGEMLMDKVIKNVIS